MALSLSSQGRTLKRADPSTIQNKFMVGYQGWFTCAGDGPPLDPNHHGWLHWFNYPVPDGGRPNTDLWPDVSEYSPSELYPAPGIKYASGEQAFLFSSRHPRTVQRHFHWMAQHGVDGAFLQRFAGQTDLEAGNEAIRNQRDEVGDRVREAAEKEGRVFAIMYDVSGVAPDRIQRVIEHDWMHLIHDKGVLDSPNYVREHGKAVVTFWGFGFADSRHDPATVRAIARFVRDNTPGGAYIMAGTPAHWRTSVSDADTNPEFVNVWLEEFDAISPWTIGRYHNEDTADWFEKEKIKGDVELINERNRLWEQGKPGTRKIDYIPVIFPGGSGHNLSEGKWGWNDAPRQGGRFMWRQLWNVRRNGVRTVYGAMWDEYDEGTAYMPVVSHKSQLPVLKTHNFMALDEDGYDLPSDWYMRICGFAGESLRGERMVHETFPAKELQDYWSTRPRYEDNNAQAGGSGSADGKWQTYEDWKNSGIANQDIDEAPPPYSLEEDESTRAEPSHAAVPSPQSSTLHNVSAAPPPAPLATRPIASRSSSSSSSSSSASAQSVPPPVNPSSRPTMPHSPIAPGIPAMSRPGAYRPDHPSRQSIDSLTENFNRQSSISGHTSPRLEAPPRHPAHPDAQRTYGPPPVPSRDSGSLPHHQHPSHGASSGSWSQTSWPPPEWGSHTGPAPAPHGPQLHSSYPVQAYGTGHSSYNYGPSQMPGYAPGYMPHSPPPPLRPRPSSSHSPRPYPQSPVDEPKYPEYNQPPSPYNNQDYPAIPHSPHSPHRPPFPPPGPGAQFPQAHPSMLPQNYYSDAPQPQPYGGSYSYPASPGPPRPYDFPTPMNGPPHLQGGPYYGGPPPRPQPPPGSYPQNSGQPSGGRPSLSSNPVDFARDMLSQGEARLQNLVGSKLWNK